MRRFVSSRLNIYIVTFSALLLVTLFITYSCRKINQENSNEPSSTVYDKFFAVPDNTHSLVKAIAASIKQQDKQRHFVLSLSQKAGFPIWHKAIIATRDYIGGRETGDSGGEVVVIPFVKEGGAVTNALLIVNTGTAGRDSSYKLVYAATYEDYGFTSADSTKATAKNVFHLFTVFDNEIFGYTKFEVKDWRIISGNPKDSTQESTVTLVDGHGTGYTNRMTSITFCNTWEICRLCGFRTGLRVTDGCRCGSDFYTACTTIWIDIGGDGGGGIGGGTGGGGGGGGGWENTNPCRTRPDINPCGTGGGTGPGGWVPIIDDTQYPPNDSLLAVQLKRVYEKIKTLADSCHNKAFEQNKEHTFTIVQTPTDTIGMWPRAGSENQSDPALSGNFFGIDHTHQDSGATDPYKNQSFDGPDIYKLYYHINKNEHLNVSIITTRDFVYAAIVTDETKFKNYIRTLCGSQNINVIESALYNLHIDGMDNCSTCTWQKKSEWGTLAITANNNAGISGIKVFRSPRQNIHFTPITQ